MSIQIMSLVWGDYSKELTLSEKSVLLRMADYAAHDGTNIYPAISTLADEVGISESGTKKSIKGLINKNRITKIHRTGNDNRCVSNLYYINIELLQQKYNESDHLRKKWKPPHTVKKSTHSDHTEQINSTHSAPTEQINSTDSDRNVNLNTEIGSPSDGGRGYPVTGGGLLSTPNPSLDPLIYNNNNIPGDLKYIDEGLDIKLHEQPQDDVSQADVVTEQRDESDVLLLLNDLNVNWNSRKVLALIAKHGRDYFLEKVKVLKDATENKPSSVSNPSGYLQAALTHDYQILEKATPAAADNMGHQSKLDASRNDFGVNTTKTPSFEVLNSWWLSKEPSEQARLFSIAKISNWTYLNSLDELDKLANIGLFIGFLETMFMHGYIKLPS